MPIFDIYSRRKRRAEQAEPDVYQYEAIPAKVRTQIRFILESALGAYSDQPYADQNNDVWDLIRNTIRREKGLAVIYPNAYDSREEVINAIITFEKVDDCLDLIDLCFRCVNRMRGWSEDDRRYKGIKQDPDDAIEELNFRFRDACVGYQFEAGEIVRVDSQLIHSEVVKPALVLLGDPRFDGAQDEFLSAHAHYRAGEYEDAVLDANRAFESSMKTICDIKGWEPPKGARASDLVKILRRNKLLPDYLEPSFDQLIATLQSGLPKVRNEVAGHGQGAILRQTPGYVAGYALHLAAANIVLLVEAFKTTEH
jgi:Domain of unknown function (DUF7014)/AbiJ N-terminal domain 4